jgi:hypothetical protein
MPRGLVWPTRNIQRPAFGSVEIIPEHPLARGLTLCYLLNERAGMPFDLVTGNRSAAPALEEPFWTWRNARRGPAVQSANSLARTPHTLNLNAGTTVAMLRQKDDLILRAVAHFSLEGPADARVQSHCPFDDGIVYWDFGDIFTVPASHRLTWGGYSVSKDPESWVFVAGATGQAIYFNGQVVASHSTATTTTGGSQQFNINGGKGTDTGDLVFLYLFLVSTYEWNASDVLQFYLNPYSFLRPIAMRQPRSPVALAVGPMFVGA